MPPDPAGDRAAMRGLFAHIARTYDCMNRLMTLGQDRRWRRDALHRASLAPGSRLLDLGCGTGEVARQALKLEPGLRVIAADITPEMMRLGRSRPETRGVRWVVADALRLPFGRGTFDAVISAFLLRNVAKLDLALDEQKRVLRPGGRVISLDTTPARGWHGSLLRFYLRGVVPALAHLVTGNAPAYNYLAASTESFVPANHLADHLLQAGFQEVGFVRRTMGAVAIHWGRKA